MDFTIKSIINKKKCWLLLLKHNPFCEPSRAVFSEIPFIYSPAEFTLCRPPSEAVPCLAMHHTPRLSSLPGFPPLFPVFWSQHDIAINKQLKKATYQRALLTQFQRMLSLRGGCGAKRERDETTGGCVALQIHVVGYTATKTNKNRAQRILTHKY